MKNYFLPMLLSLFFLGACDKNDEIIPEDADENFITSVVMTVDGKSYTADITDNTVMITVPYTVSLNNAEVEFKYTTSATIIPDPETVTDWDNERTFRVTSYNGDAREYAYKVVKSEIESDGDVELKTIEEVASFAATKTTVVKGNLIIGSDVEEAEKITDISALASLKEVTGNIIIRNSYNGADLTGLDNIASAGGLQIGSVEAPSKATELHMISMKALETLSGDISVYNDQVTYVLFEKLATIGGSVMFNAPSLQSFEFPVLTSVDKDLNIQGLNGENKAAGTISSLELSELTSVGGVLSVNNLAKLTSINLLKLKETGGLDFHTVPVMLETINLPEIETVNGSIIMEANMEAPPAGSFVPQRNDVLLAFGGMDKLTTVKGQIKIKNFTALKQLPDWSKITTLGSITLDYLEDLSGTLTLPNARFETFGETAPQIEIISKMLLNKIETAEDLSNVDFVVKQIQNFKFPEITFKSINNFTCTPTTNNTDYTIPTIQHVYGNLHVTSTTTDCKAKFPDLEIVDGYGYIQIITGGTVEMPALKEVGGQFYMSGLFKGCDLPLLSKVCCSASPVYYEEGEGSLAITLQNKSLDLPELLHVGGEGLFVDDATGITCNKLQTIDGTLQIKYATSLSQETLSMETLETLHGVFFNGLTKFTDYTFFGKFIENGMITEENWSVAKCGYNPDFQNMKDKKYTQE
ncbi:epidermal growth-factor receptor (EGFR) L domain protein [Bacteroides sp.]|uniref:epidermal growth-factor receptor (EGFR) L domain protein n=1 Tax=Bacteroides sp. TaxID=29523 RepID=UPI002585E422|nr:epidermal growth-factor receptor (EGFR) L domain protein [Bacteroides sp.]